MNNEIAVVMFIISYISMEKWGEYGDGSGRLAPKQSKHRC